MAKALRLITLLVLLTSCSGNAFRWSSDYHTVRAGETVFSIADKYDIAQRDLIRWNHLGDGTLIRQGQKLRITSPSGAGSSSGRSAARQPVVPAPAWRWPTDGQVLLRFGESVKTESGIRIGGKPGQRIVAVASGEVVYAGGGLPTYGQLLIIKHNPVWLSAYGFNQRLLVAEGQQVRAGQVVAGMGLESGGRAALHFEIRRNGEPVDPLRYLPAR